MSRRHQGLGTSPPKVDRVWETLQRIWGYMATQKQRFIMVITAILVSSSLSLLGPYLLGKTVDLVIEVPSRDTLVGMLVLLLILYVCQSVFLWLQNYLMIDIAQGSVRRMRNHLFSHVQKLPVLYFQRMQQGELMSRLTNDIENVSRTMNTAVVQFITSVLTLTGTIVLMLWLSPLLTLLTLTIVPVMYFGMKWITKRTGPFFKQQQTDLGEVNGYVEEMFTGQPVVRMFSKEQRVIERFEKKNEALRESGYYAQVYTGFIPKLMNMLNNVSFAIIIGAGGILALNGSISIGVIVAFTTYSRQFTRPLNDLANQFNMILSAVAGAQRVFQVLDEEVEGEVKEEPLESISGDIRFDSVSFAYEEGQPTLVDINFVAEPGETIALVGPTGAGKTTILSLLSRFYDPDAGAIYLDGVDLQRVPRSWLRSRMGVVLQDATMFHLSIRENIRYGRLEATDEEVEAAAKAARAHEFIVNLPEGYETVLDSDGKGVSHGQRQLLSIARAMIADPSLLILDEATSSIDSLTESKINTALQRLMAGRTSFVIAHRLHTIRSADKILVMQHGKIIEQGSHRRLMNQGGFYADLIKAQSPVTEGHHQ
ncbi:ABC transporter ATP-binding protein [Halobacillus sp. BAB-2008]|uniref:ABC transporter ATP-binding protein n=1 Tax=Halobacillus sp. BAB-2008 TaxID=1246484 RepID=UPI0002A517C2|nr:ABC transporter ATP-binding protein [Halobacillus sp. BAB-2008]ELK46343.1 ABC-type transport system ATP-binding/permease protein [Halobacillus sp. BAB-2008]